MNGELVPKFRMKPLVPNCRQIITLRAEKQARSKAALACNYMVHAIRAYATYMYTCTSGSSTGWN